eukprot:TRINITY_DN9807_c0_g1_i1.p1 TRINITY_DN9807_c0_g1~~TRINITY_DN9807_c0_g1_i1.p1  ORF type:complete len:515 (-),score=98.47 TRINITY_DN9807_c0_g1_i1:80-1534(-)
MDTTASRQIDSPPHWIFPAFGSVLNPKLVHKNPERPERDDGPEAILEQTTLSSASFSVALRFQREGDHEWQWCPVFFVGEATDPPIQVCLRTIPAGWYSIVPIAGKYDIVIENRESERYAVVVFIDGVSCAHKIMKPKSTIELKDFELRSSEVIPGAPFDEEDASTIDFCFYRVASKEIVDVQKLQHLCNVGDVNLDPINVEDVTESNPELHALEVKRVVNETKKNNIHFMNFTVPPRRKRVREDDKAALMQEMAAADAHAAAASSSQNGASSSPLGRRRSSRLNKSTEEKKNLSCLWRLDGIVEDSALQRGVLRVHYRTDIWATSAGWLQDEVDEEEALLLRQDHDDDRPLSQPASVDDDMPLHLYAPSPRARSIVKFEAEPSPFDRPFLPGIKRDSTIFDFFAALAERLSRELSDYRDIIERLESSDIHDVNGMLQVSEDDWLDRFILDGMYSAHQRRNIRNSITQSLQLAKLTSDVVDLTS